MGSTVIRGLHGLASTRKSIQRLKLESTKSDWNAAERPSSSDDSGLLNNIKTSTHALKETNQQLRQEVGIALSHCGVRFIDLENKVISKLKSYLFKHNECFTWHSLFLL